MPAHSAVDPMTEAHEERIQRLENSVTTLVAQVSEQGVELKHVSEKIDSNQEQLLSKFGEISTALNTRLEHGDQLFDKLHRTVSKQQDDINDLKAKEKLRERSRSRRNTILRKIAVALILGVGGVFAHKLGIALWLLVK